MEQATPMPTSAPYPYAGGGGGSMGNTAGSLLGGPAPPLPPYSPTSTSSTSEINYEALQSLLSAVVTPFDECMERLCSDLQRIAVLNAPDEVDMTKVLCGEHVQEAMGQVQRTIVQFFAALADDSGREVEQAVAAERARLGASRRDLEVSLGQSRATVRELRHVVAQLESGQRMLRSMVSQANLVVGEKDAAVTSLERMVRAQEAAMDEQADELRQARAEADEYQRLLSVVSAALAERRDRIAASRQAANERVERWRNELAATATAVDESKSRQLRESQLLAATTGGDGGCGGGGNEEGSGSESGKESKKLHVMSSEESTRRIATSDLVKERLVASFAASRGRVPTEQEMAVLLAKAEKRSSDFVSDLKRAAEAMGDSEVGEGGEVPAPVPPVGRAAAAAETSTTSTTDGAEAADRPKKSPRKRRGLFGLRKKKKSSSTTTKKGRLSLPGAVELVTDGEEEEDRPQEEDAGGDADKAGDDGDGDGDGAGDVDEDALDQETAAAAAAAFLQKGPSSQSQKTNPDETNQKRDRAETLIRQKTQRWKQAKAKAGKEGGGGEGDDKKDCRVM